MWYSILADPELSPKIVIKFGSPANRSIFLCTHFSAKTWSFIAAFPGTPKDSSSKLKNPESALEFSVK